MKKKDAKYKDEGDIADDSTLAAVYALMSYEKGTSPSASTRLKTSSQRMTKDLRKELGTNQLNRNKRNR